MEGLRVRVQGLESLGHRAVEVQVGTARHTLAKLEVTRDRPGGSTGVTAIFENKCSESVCSLSPKPQMSLNVPKHP